MKEIKTYVREEKLEAVIRALRTAGARLDLAEARLAGAFLLVETIALAGLDAELGILMLLYLNLAYRQRELQGRMHDMSDLTEAIVEGAVRRLRPKLMTGMALLAGLAPIFWSTGAGADVMKRIAAPMVGGIASALVMVLVVFPAIYALWKGHDMDRNALK